MVVNRSGGGGEWSKIELVVEGSTKLEVPELERFKTPSGDYAPSLTRVFYNPLMEFCRDISVALIQVLAEELGKITICDPLAGVGARGLRYAQEVEGVARVVVNDRSPQAIEFIRKNLELNRLGGVVEVKQEDANSLLWSARPKFDVVDLDPFGSPAPFLDAACSALSSRGMLALTATDTAPLCGAQPKACVRRYGAKPLRTEYCRELGVRILVGFCQRVAGKHELAFSPLLAHATRHYFRLYLRARRGARAAYEACSKLGYISHCFSCGFRRATEGLIPELPPACECGAELSHAGPLWLGPLAEEGFLKRVRSELAQRGFKQEKSELSLLDECLEEAKGPPTFYDLNKLAGRAGVRPPKLRKLVAKLKHQGYFASRTHFLGTGLRTDAPLAKLLGFL